MSKRWWFRVHGKRMWFSTKQIEEILEEHIPKGKIFLPKVLQETKKPTVGKCFKVSLETINMDLFLKKRNNEQQEYVRKLILRAFRAIELENIEEFYLLIPEKKWVYEDDTSITVEELIHFAEEIGSIATWIEVALSWAQEITNEKGSKKIWESICNNPDTIEWFRLCIWTTDEPRVIGGAFIKQNRNPSSEVEDFDYDMDELLIDTVPYIKLKSLIVN